MGLRFAMGVVLVCVGVAVGLLLRLKWGILGDIPDATMSLLGSLLGAGLGAAASFMGAYFLWQKQLHRTEAAFGDAAASAISVTAAGAGLLLSEIERRCVHRPDGDYELTPETLDAIVMHGAALSDAVSGAKTNIDRVAQSLGSLGTLRVPWFMYAEQAVTGLGIEAAKLQKGTSLVGTPERPVLFNGATFRQIEYFRKSIAAAVEELRSEAPSLERLATLHDGESASVESAFAV